MDSPAAESSTCSAALHAKPFRKISQPYHKSQPSQPKPVEDKALIFSALNSLACMARKAGKPLKQLIYNILCFTLNRDASDK